MTPLIVAMLLMLTPTADVDINIDFAKPDYSACCRAVERGETVYLAIGVTPEPDDYYTPSLKYPDGREFVPGRYKCWKEKEKAVMVAVEVPPLPTFPGAVRSDRVKPSGATPVVAGNKSHYCPNCGAGQWLRIMGWNADGTHNHFCESCKTLFAH